MVLSLQGFAAGTAEDLVPERTAGPEDLLVHREKVGYLHHAIAALPERLRRVVEAYFFEELPMADIAAELGVTESRVSQLRAEALVLLRDGLNAHLDPDLVGRAGPAGRLRGPPARGVLRADHRAGRPAQPARVHRPQRHAPDPHRVATCHRCPVASRFSRDRRGIRVAGNGCGRQPTVYRLKFPGKSAAIPQGRTVRPDVSVDRRHGRSRRQRPSQGRRNTMGLRINQNIAAQNAYRNLSVTDGQMSKSLEKLSSGFRINRAADDAAGLAISEGLRSQVGGLKIAVRNAQDGVSASCRPLKVPSPRCTAFFSAIVTCGAGRERRNNADGSAGRRSTSEFSALADEIDGSGPARTSTASSCSTARRT